MSMGLCKNNVFQNLHCQYSKALNSSHLKFLKESICFLIRKCWICWPIIINIFAQQVLIETPWSQSLWCFRSQAHLKSPLSLLAEASRECSFCCFLDCDQKSSSLLGAILTLFGVPQKKECVQLSSNPSSAASMSTISSLKDKSLTQKGFPLSVWILHNHQVFTQMFRANYPGKKTLHITFTLSSYLIMNFRLKYCPNPKTSGNRSVKGFKRLAYFVCRPLSKPKH